MCVCVCVTFFGLAVCIMRVHLKCSFENIAQLFYDDFFLHSSFSSLWCLFYQLVGKLKEIIVKYNNIIMSSTLWQFIKQWVSFLYDGKVEGKI